MAGLATLAPSGGAAWAEDGIKLSVGGFFRSAYQVVIDDDAEGELGNNTNTDGILSDAEIHFVGRTTLDNGLEVGARVELEGETEHPTEGSAGNGQIDEAWIWFSGGFGEIRIGSDDDALANACVMPPGGTTNFSAFSPNQWGANNNADNSVCTGVVGPDDQPDAQKIIYITPVFGGFQLTTSYTPDPDAKDHTNNGGPHLGMGNKDAVEPDYAVSAYLTYVYEGDGWGLTWGGGVSLQAGFEQEEDTGRSQEIFEQDFYQTGLTLQFGNFAIGGAFEYFNDILHFVTDSSGNESRFDIEAWAAGGGVAYTYDAWTFGAQYSYGHRDFERADSFNFDEQLVTQRAVLTANYALGPGINVDGELAYTWADTDPEDAQSFGADDYDGFEIGIGTAISF
jgi:predicted porin